VNSLARILRLIQERSVVAIDNPSKYLLFGKGEQYHNAVFSHLRHVLRKKRRSSPRGDHHARTSAKVANGFPLHVTKNLLPEVREQRGDGSFRASFHKRIAIAKTKIESGRA